jgi:hypothetical protein
MEEVLKLYLVSSSFYLLISLHDTYIWIAQVDIIIYISLIIE